MGFYRFGTVAAKTDKSIGCRVPFATPVPPLSCPSKVAEDLHPKDPLFTEPGTQVMQSKNANVLWGWGSRFTLAIVMHDYIDPHHSGASKSQDHVYFLGSGEMSSSIVNASAQYEPTKFSVWKGRGGYAADFWFKGKPKEPIPLDKRFHFYNTKMYLYWPK